MCFIVCRFANFMYICDVDDAIGVNDCCFTIIRYAVVDVVVISHCVVVLWCIPVLLLWLLRSVSMVLLCMSALLSIFTTRVLVVRRFGVVAAYV